MIRTMTDDKELLYSMVRREIANYLGRCCPALSPFSNVVANKLIAFADPYITAFMEWDRQPPTLNTEQLSAFAQDEVNNKIRNFKERFEKEKITSEENQTNIESATR